MLFLILGIIVLVSLVLWAVVLVQNPKGGGLSSSFGGGSVTNLIGAKKSVDFVERATWYLGIAIVVLVLLSTSMLPRGGQSELDIEVDPTTNTDPGPPQDVESNGDEPFNGEPAAEDVDGDGLGGTE